jgi:hypothetical protein
MNAPVVLSPADDLRVVNMLMANINNTPGLSNIHGGNERARELLMRIKRNLGGAVIFRHLGNEARQDVYELGREGLPTRTVKTTCRGVWGLWWCLANRGGLLRTTDLSDPDVDDPDASVRRQIRKTAAQQFASWGMPELEAAALACTVAHGMVDMQLAVNAPMFIVK